MILWFCACATVQSAGPTPEGAGGRTYDLSEQKTQGLVRTALEKRGIVLHATDDPHVFLSEPIDLGAQNKRAATNTTFALSTASVPASEGRATGFEDVAHDRTWRVIFSPSKGGTAIRIDRADRFGWSMTADHSSGPADAGFGFDAAELVFVRDREQEALITADIDGSTDFEISASANTEEPTAMVMPLGDPTPNAEFVSLALGSCGIDVDPISKLLAPGHMVLLADPFGAREPWAVLDQLLCEVAARRVPVTLALALPTTDQAVVNTFLDSKGTPDDRKALLKSGFWLNPWQDGRSGIATLRTLERIRAARTAGARITVMTLVPEVLGNIRQGHMAAAILRHRGANPDRLIIVMHGNVTITRAHGTEWDQQFFPLGARLAAVLPDQTHAFDVGFETGTHWSCHMGEGNSMRCGTWSAVPGPSQSRAWPIAPPTFRVHPQVSPEGFNGLYFVGKLTTSLPALGLWKDEGRPELRQFDDPDQPF